MTQLANLPNLIVTPYPQPLSLVGSQFLVAACVVRGRGSCTVLSVRCRSPIRKHAVEECKNFIKAELPVLIHRIRHLVLAILLIFTQIFHYKVNDWLFCLRVDLVFDVESNDRSFQGMDGATNSRIFSPSGGFHQGKTYPIGYMLFWNHVATPAIHKLLHLGSVPYGQPLAGGLITWWELEVQTVCYYLTPAWLKSRLFPTVLYVKLPQRRNCGSGPSPGRDEPSHGDTATGPAGPHVVMLIADVINMSILLRFEMVEPSTELTAGSGVPVTIAFKLALKVSVQSKISQCLDRFVALPGHGDGTPTRGPPVLANLLALLLQL